MTTELDNDLYNLFSSLTSADSSFLQSQLFCDFLMKKYSSPNSLIAISNGLFFRWIVVWDIKSFYSTLVGTTSSY